MAYGLPTRSQPDWDDELNNSIEALRSDVQTAVANASAAVSTANAAHNRADSVHTAVIDAPDGAVAEVLSDEASAATAALLAVDADDAHPLRVQQDARQSAAIAAVTDPMQTELDAVPTTYETQTRVRETGINVKAHGAVGDWDGSTGTDNLAAMEAAAAALPSGGGRLHIPAGDYLLSNPWNIDLENIEVVCDPDATIRTNTATTDGHVVAFMGHYGSGTAVTPQRNSARWIGGAIASLSGGTNENGLGCVRYKNFTVHDLRVPIVGRKGITAQYGVDNIEIVGCNITDARYEGISVETDCKHVRIVGNRIDDATQSGIRVMSVTSGDATDVHIEGNRIASAGIHGIWVEDFTRAWIKDNSIIQPTQHGILCQQGDGLHVRGNDVLFPGRHGIIIETTGTSIEVEGNYLNTPSFSSAGTYSGLVFTTVTTRPRVRGNRISGGSHAYNLIMTGSTGYEAISMDNDFPTAVTATYSPAPVVGLDLVNGAAVKTGAW